MLVAAGPLLVVLLEMLAAVPLIVLVRFFLDLFRLSGNVLADALLHSAGDPQRVLRVFDVITELLDFF